MQGKINCGPTSFSNPRKVSILCSIRKLDSTYSCSLLLHSVPWGGWVQWWWFPSLKMWICSQAKCKSSEFITSYTVAFCPPLLLTSVYFCEEEAYVGTERNHPLFAFLLGNLILPASLHQLHHPARMHLQTILCTSAPLQYFISEISCSAVFTPGSSGSGQKTDEGRDIMSRVLCWDWRSLRFSHSGYYSGSNSRCLHLLVQTSHWTKAARPCLSAQGAGPAVGGVADM